MPRGGVDVHLCSFFNLGTRCGWVFRANVRMLNPLSPGKKLGTEFTGGWVRPQDRSGRVREVSPPSLGFDPRTVYPVASRYTD